MRRISIPLVLVASFCGGMLHAGVEPSPFHPQIVKLEAIEHVLLVTYDNEDRLLSAPAEKQLPPGPLGAQLKAIRFHLALEEAQIVSVVTPILIEGVVPEEVVPALEGVGTAVQGIQNRAAAGFAYPTDDPEVLEALAGVEAQASSIVNTTSTLLPPAPCLCWDESEIAYSTGESPFMYNELGIDEPGMDYFLFQGNDEDINLSFWTRSENGNAPYECYFGHEGGFVPEWGLDSVERRISLPSFEMYEACAASICRQILAAPAWYHNAFGAGPYDPSQCTSIVGE